MRNQRSVSLDNTPVLAPTSQYLKFKLHSDTESDVTSVRDYGNSGAFTNDLLDIGGASHTYAAGYITPSGDQDGTHDSTEIRNLVRLDTLSGGILVMFNVKVTASPASASNVVLFAGQGSIAGFGGWDIRHGTSGLFQIRYRMNAAASPSSGGNVTVPQDGTQHTVGLYIDTSGALPVIYGYLDGVLASTSSDLPAPFAPKVTRVFGLFLDRNGDTSEDDQINSNSEDSDISDLWLVRFETDQFATAGDAIAEYALNPRAENLRALAGI
jgi:hypothetical protein